jgi:hypothetical protein
MTGAVRGIPFDRDEWGGRGTPFDRDEWGGRGTPFDRPSVSWVRSLAALNLW